MKITHLILGILALGFSSTAGAVGGYAGYIAGELGHGGGWGHPGVVTNSTLSPVITKALPQFGATNRYQQSPIGGYAGFIAQQQRVYPPSNQSSTRHSGFFYQNNSTRLPVCRDVPAPTSATCNGGNFVPIRNFRGCVVSWQCRGGTFCPAAQPPAAYCDGTLRPQINSRGCLTHYFCRRNVAQPRSFDQVRTCSSTYLPVCGVRGNQAQTYLNQCRLTRAGATFVHFGECRKNS